MLLVPEAAPLARVLREILPDGLVVAPGFLPGCIAFGSEHDADPLDDRFDPRIDRPSLAERLTDAQVPRAAAPILADALADREGVVDVSRLGAPPPEDRPMTLFERHALVDVLGAELASLLPTRRVRIDRAFLRSGLNHCEMDGDLARIRLLSTNGTTLAGRTHALVHELGHALIGVARRDGRSYAAAYGSPDFGRFLHPRTFDRPCDEEALVRALADAWLLRRNVAWARTWPGAVDDVARDLDADALAAFVRFRLAQGLGLPHEPVVVKRV